SAAMHYSPEYRELQANEATLLRLAEVSHGQVYPPLGSKPKEDLGRLVFRRDRRAATAPQDLWPALLLLAALLFPMDVGIRRLMIDPAEALAYARLVLARLQARLSQRSRRRVAPPAEALSRPLAAQAAASERLGPTSGAAAIPAHAPAATAPPAT